MKKFWSVFLVFIMAFSVRVFFIHQKSGLHVDEALAYVISSGNNYGWTNNFFVNTEYTGSEIVNLTIGNPPSVKDAIKDVASMYVDNRDHPLTNLYYSALRLSSCCAEDYGLNSLINRGCALNLLFFCISFCYFFKLLQVLFKEEDKQKYIPFALLIAYMNTGAISNTLFLRPYQLQETMCVVMTYIFVLFYNDIKENKFNLHPKKFVLTAFVMSLVTLSGYFSLIYEGLLGLVLLAICFKHKAYKAAGSLVGLFVLNLIFANLLYLGFILGFTSYRAADVYSAGVDFISNLKLSASRIIVLFTHYLFYPVVLIAAFISAFFAKKKERNNLLWIIVLCAFVWSAVVMYLAPYKILRYIVPVFPLLSLVLADFVQKINFKAVYFYSFLYLWAAIFASSLDYGAPRPEKIIPFSAPVENVFRRTDEQFAYRYKPDLPVFISEAEPWTATNLFTYVNPSQKYKFVDFSFFEQKLYPKNSFIIYPKEKSLPEEETFLKLDCGLYYKCFEITD